MNSLWGNIFKGTGEHEESVLSVLGEIPVFEGLSKRELRAVERIMHHRHYNAEEVIFGQNVQGLGMYIILTGKVAVINEPTGQVIAELEKGEFFGELALLDESPRSAAAVAKTHCSMLGFFQPDLISLTESNPKLGVKVVTALARVVGRRLRATNEQLQTAHEELVRLRGLKED